jgi:S1-C subfamily serine protease
VLFADDEQDLAVLKIRCSSPLPAVRLALGTVASGERVSVIGNPGLGATILDHTVTEGLVSSPLRELEGLRLIQTSAQVNPGSSGGPMFNSRGQVIGINTAIESVSGQRGFGGIGFAVPSSTASRYLDRLIAGEQIQHSWLGVSLSEVTPTVARTKRLGVSAGVLVEDVLADSPARQAGLQAGDVVTAVDGVAVHSADELGDQVDRAKGPGDTVSLTVQRGREQLTLPLTLGAWPEPLPNNPR